MNNVDKTALKLLFKYDVLAETYKRLNVPLSEQQKKYADEFGIAQEDFNYMRDKGLAFDCVDIDHDSAVKKCFDFMRKLSKKKITDSFLASLSTGRLEYRSGLAAYAIMQTMPEHKYINNKANCCEICSGKPVNHFLDLTYLNSERFMYGGMTSFRTPYELMFFLERQSAIDLIAPCADDFRIFNAILNQLENAKSDCKPKDMQKQLRKIEGFKANTEQCAVILETLGFCSILETSNHEGYLTKYTNTGLAPHKSHSSNWAYPVDFWTGKDKLNKNALTFWFGEYKEVHIN